jgi:hypothetical protein
MTMIQAADGRNEGRLLEEREQQKGTHLGAIQHLYSAATAHNVILRK